MEDSYNHSTELTKCQEQLTGKKASARVLAQKLLQAGEIKTAERIHYCGDVVILRHFSDGTSQIAGAQFCKQRLCPLCSWRRARRNSQDISDIMTYMDKLRTDAGYNPYGWIAFSFSPRAVPLEKLALAIDRLSTGWNKLTKMDTYKRAIKGAVRAIEIRQSDGKYNSAVKGWWQPHIHAILAVNQSYFTDKTYIPVKKWEELLLAALDVDRVQLHAERIDSHPGRLEGSAVETAKYIVKAPHGLSDLRTDELASLNQIIRRRRLLAYYGDMKIAHHALGLEDNETGNLLDRPLRADLQSWLEMVAYKPGEGYIPITADAVPPAIINQLPPEERPPQDLTRYVESFPGGFNPYPFRHSKIKEPL